MKKFHLTENYCLINFDATTCESIINVIQSKSFELVFEQFINKLKNDNDQILDDLNYLSSIELLNVYKLLLIYDFEEIVGLDKNYQYLVSIRETLYLFTEKLYDYWRKLERFGLMQASKQYEQETRTAEFIKTADDFNEKVLYLYRTISQKLLGKSYNVYRQLPAGVNANILYVQHRFSDNNKFTNLQNIGFVTNILTRPPFIFYTKSNTRNGYFEEISFNPLLSLDINRLHYLVFSSICWKIISFCLYSS